MMLAHGRIDVVVFPLFEVNDPVIYVFLPVGVFTAMIIICSFIIRTGRSPASLPQIQGPQEQHISSHMQTICG